MAISWISALKLVPWGEVIDAAPQVIKAAKGLVRKKDAQQQERQTAEAAAGALPQTATSSGELALTQVHQLSERVELLEQSQRQSLELIEKLAEQNAQLVATVGALRVGAQRLAIACGVLGATCLGLVIYAILQSR